MAIEAVSYRVGQNIGIRLAFYILRTFSIARLNLILFKTFLEVLCEALSLFV